MIHTMKIRGRVVEAFIEREAMISEQQHGFMLRRALDGRFALSVFMDNPVDPEKT